MAQEKVYPSAGHHDKDPGAIANGYKETDVTKEFRNLVLDEFNKNDHPYITDKDWETNSQYQGRIKPGNGSVLLDFHLNAAANPTATGTEVYIAANANGHSLAFATKLSDVTAQILNIKNRGVKRENASQHSRIGILHRGAGIAALLEICFITNKSDMEKYQANKLELAKAIAKVCIEFDDLIE